MDEEKDLGGRPPKFDTPEQMKAACDEYIASNTGMLTITGLAMWLGFCDRQSLYDYEKKTQFSCIVKEARLAVENGYEISLRSAQVVGSIFALKNMGWKDHSRTELTGADGKDLNYNVTLDLGGNTKHTNEPVPGPEDK